MELNDKILTMVQRTPGIRTGQLADQLDMDIADIEPLLDQLVLGRKLSTDLVPLAGGGRVREYHTLARIGEKPAAPAPAAAYPLVDAIKVGAAAMPATPAPATPAQAAEAISQKRAYNRRAPGPAPKSAAPTDAQVRERLGLDLVERAPEAAAPAAQSVVDKAIGALPEEYRVGFWSDGTIELQLNGEEVARITKRELAVINAFMASRAAA